MTIRVLGPDADAEDTGQSLSDAPDTRRWEQALRVAVVAVAASPIVVAALTLVGDRWFPIGDWAGLVFRTSQVGSSDTPLVGFDSVKGWAHPGPLLFWLAAPLYRLTGGDPRALAWTAGIFNVAAVAGLGMVAWRRGRWPVLLATMAFVAVLIRGIGPERMVDLWVSYLPLLAFLVTIFLVWDAALGRSSSLVVAVAVASFTAQTHLAYVSLNAVLAIWMLGWYLRGPKAMARPDLARALRRSAVVVGVLWVGPILDALFDLHNPWNIAKSFGSGTARVGLVEAIGLVGRYVRPDGPWLGGVEPTGSDTFSVQGSGALPLLVALAALAACTRLGLRRGLHDVVALTTLALTLVIGAVPAAAQIPVPNEFYYTQWLKVVGGLAWFAVAWTGWRLAEPALRAAPVRKHVAATLATATLLVTVAATWGEARSVEFPFQDVSRVVRSLDSQLRDADLPRDDAVRVVRRGEYFHFYGAGVTYALIDQGYDIVADEGRAGLKWGHAHRWRTGDEVDLVLTVAMNDGYTQCEWRSDARMVASYDGLAPEVRDWLGDVQLRRLDGDTTAAEERRADALAADDLRVGVFAGPAPCARDVRDEITRTSDSSILPVAAAAAALLAVAAGWRARRRRRF